MASARSVMSSDMLPPLPRSSPNTSREGPTSLRPDRDFSARSGPVFGDPPGPMSAGLPDGLDKVPLAHLGAPGDPLALGYLVEFLPGPVLVVVAGTSTSLPGFGGLS